MLLPLLDRAGTDDGTFVHVSRAARSSSVDLPRSSSSCGVVSLDRIPDRRPAAGEQFRFHVDMGACIGCKCCVVACNEQNGNPASINWRRVGEIEGGVFPTARRAYFSMGCNHCLEPTCLQGCPVDAYSKDPVTGIVGHSAETCIGCQYCTWTCSYGVPQFNAERGVVGKCDMCHGRLSAGQAPACVSACPEGAIAIEIVNVADWRAEVQAAVGGSGRPVHDASLSATRVTMPAHLPTDARATDTDVPEPGDPHAPLVLMTVLTQLAAGATAALWLMWLVGVGDFLAWGAAFVAVITGGALAASTAHLGRPIHAYRAMKMWRRSWLSREVVLFGIFSQMSVAFAGSLFFMPSLAAPAGAAAALSGLAGVTASAFIYRVRSRPSWDTPWTVVRFFLTTLLLGSLTAAVAAGSVGVVWRLIAAAAACATLALFWATYRADLASSSIELRGGARLLRQFPRSLWVRVGGLVLGGVLLPLASAHPAVLGLALLLATIGELAGRYLFFVAAVPRHMTAAYVMPGREAA